MKKLSLPSSPGALRRIGTKITSSSSSSPTGSPKTRSSAKQQRQMQQQQMLLLNKHAGHGQQRGGRGGRGGNGHGAQQLTLSFKSRAAAAGKSSDDDSSWFDFSETTTVGGSSSGSTSASEDEWESSFDPLWVVDQHELELRRSWTEKKGFTASSPPSSASTAPGAPAESGRRLSPLAINSTVVPAQADRQASPLATTKPVSPTATGPLSYAKMLEATTASAKSSASQHSPATSPRSSETSASSSASSSAASSPLASSGSSLLPALDLVQPTPSSPASLGSSRSRRNTIATPRNVLEQHSTAESERSSAAVQPWKVGRVSPHTSSDGVSLPTNQGDSHDGQPRFSPRKYDLTLSFERFEKQLAKRQSSEEGRVEALNTSQSSAPSRSQAKTSRSSSKRLKKNAKSLGGSKEQRRKKNDEKKAKRRSEGSPPLQLRSQLSKERVKDKMATENRDDAVEGYLAEEESDGARQMFASHSDSSANEEDVPTVSPVASTTAAPVGKHSRHRQETQNSLNSGALRARSTDHKIRRTITKEDINGNRSSELHLNTASPSGTFYLSDRQSDGRRTPEFFTSTDSDDLEDEERYSPRGEDDELSSGRRTPELTWKTIWNECPAATPLSSPSSSTPASGELAQRRIMKRGLEGRSSSLPATPLLTRANGQASQSSGSLASSPFRIINPTAPTTPSPSNSTEATATSSPSVRYHRRRAESSGHPQSVLPLMPPLMSPSVVPLSSLDRDVPSGAESGDIFLFRSQSEDVYAIEYLQSDEERDVDDGEDDREGEGRDLIGLRLVASQSINNRLLAQPRTARNWRGRSGGDWRSGRGREGIALLSSVGSEDRSLALRSRIERVRSFASPSEAAWELEDDDCELLLGRTHRDLDLPLPRTLPRPLHGLMPRHEEHEEDDDDEVDSDLESGESTTLLERNI